MTTLGQIRKAALAMPGTTESEATTSAGVRFSVGGKVFVAVSADGVLSAHLAANDADAVLHDLAAAEPYVRGASRLGVRVALAEVDGQTTNFLVRRAWFARAPRRLAAEAEAGDRAEPGAVGDLPSGIGRPATRALAGAGITSLDDVAERSPGEIGALHGVGPKAVRLLGEALVARGTRWR